MLPQQSVIFMPPLEATFSFYRKMFDLMIEATGTVICGGDWNIRLNPQLESSKTSTNT